MKHPRLVSAVRAAVAVASLLGLAAVWAANEVQLPIMAAWEKGNYQAFLQLARDLAKSSSAFGPSFNVALGLFMTDNFTEALRSIQELEKRMELTKEQRKKLADLRSEIESWRKSEDSRSDTSTTVKTDGRFTLSKDGTGQVPSDCRRYKGNQICDSNSNPQVSAAADAFRNREPVVELNSDLDAEKLAREVARNNMRAAGYDVDGRKRTALSPEVVP